MSSASRKNIASSFRLKKSLCPVSGMNSYSVFKNDVLVFMMDGDKASVFRPEEVEAIPAPDDVCVYKVGDYFFTGSLELTREIKRLVPKGCVVCPAFDKTVEL